MNVFWFEYSVGAFYKHNKNVMWTAGSNILKDSMDKSWYYFDLIFWFARVKNAFQPQKENGTSPLYVIELFHTESYSDTHHNTTVITYLIQTRRFIGNAVATMVLSLFVYCSLLVFCLLSLFKSFNKKPNSNCTYVQLIVWSNRFAIQRLWNITPYR